MNGTPYLTIDLAALEHNARAVVGLCRRHGIEVAGVTKGVCGHPEVARAMLRGGVVAIADSRLENLRRLRGAGIGVPLMLLRLPPLSAVGEVVETADSSLCSELAVLRALSASALERGRRHGVIVMVDMGDLREGVWPTDLVPFCREARGLEGIRIRGIGTNLACFGGVIPTPTNMHRLAELAREVEGALGIGLELISGLNSSGLGLIESGEVPRTLNHARIGEGILLGRETTRRRPWPGTRQDAFRLYAEILELKRKPSCPLGERAQNAFGKEPEFEDRGEILRALLNLGREDVLVEGIEPLDPRLRILGAASDYLVLEVTGGERTLGVGSVVGFSVNYGALLAAMTSDYVDKRLLPARAGGEAA